jgi:hypothetical protein
MRTLAQEKVGAAGGLRPWCQNGPGSRRAMVLYLARSIRAKAVSIELRFKNGNYIRNRGRKWRLIIHQTNYSDRIRSNGWSCGPTCQRALGPTEPLSFIRQLRALA